MEMEYMEALDLAIRRFFRERKDELPVRAYKRIHTDLARDCGYVFCDVLVERNSYIYILKIENMEVVRYRAIQYRLP